MSYNFFSKEIQSSDWVADPSGVYKLDVLASEHNQTPPLVISVFESSLTDGFKFVVGESDVYNDAKVTLSYSNPIQGRVIIRGE